MYSFMFYFIIFMIYSLLGWIMEIIVTYFETKKVINRGFLIGPYCPIYGISCLLLFLLSNTYKDDILVIFFGVIIIATIIEYSTSYLMEKLFNARWWDYTHMKFNIDGRVCLINSIGFGIMGTLVIYVFHPFLYNWLTLIPNMILFIIAIPLLILFVLDSIISLNIMQKIKTSTAVLKKDYTGEISKKVKDILSNKSILQARLLKAFPNIKFNIKLPSIKKGKNS